MEFYYRVRAVTAEVDAFDVKVEVGKRGGGAGEGDGIQEVCHLGDGGDDCVLHFLMATTFFLA